MAQGMFIIYTIYVYNGLLCNISITTCIGKQEYILTDFIVTFALLLQIKTNQ